MKTVLGILTAVLMSLSALGLMADLDTAGVSILDESSNARNSAVNQQTTLYTGARNTQNHEWLPANFTAFDNQYSVSSFTIEITEDGNTLVRCEGSGFDKIPLRYNVYQMPLTCVLMIDGGRVNSSNGSASAHTLEFLYEGAWDPDSIMLMSSDNGNQRVLIPVSKST